MALPLPVSLPLPLAAALWAGLGASALLLGALVAMLLPLSQRVISAIMALGCGVLISAVAYDLLEDGYEDGGIGPIVLGASLGALAYAGADWLIARRGAAHRKRSGHHETDRQPGEADHGGSGLAIAVGSLIDGIPESIVLGVGLLSGGKVSLAMLAAIVLSNFPEGLSSAAGMRRAGRSRAYVFGLWGGIALLSALAAGLGALLLGGASPQVLATVNAVAAGGLMTMVVNTMIPESVAGDPRAAGVLAVAGLLVAFALTNAGG